MQFLLQNSSSLDTRYSEELLYIYYKENTYLSIYQYVQLPSDDVIYNNINTPRKGFK